MRPSHRVLLSILIGAFMLSTPLSSVSAAGPVTGVATSCGGIASCNYSLSDGSGGTGTATASAGVGGYVGQSPLPFCCGYVSFTLPGETMVSYASGVYSGVAVLDGYSSTAGTLYLSTGTFYATDANTGLVVTGATSTIVGIKGHSGRGGGNTYTLVSGTITITPVTSPRLTSTTLSCGTPVPVNDPMGCIVTVTDTDVGTPVPPSGSVTFGSTGSGTFSAASCTLGGSGAASTCNVTYTPNPGSEGTPTITATYPGDNVHVAGSASQVLTVGQRGVSTSLYCASPFVIRKAITCTVTVFDISPGTPMTPAGTATFTSNHAGTFSSKTCQPQDNNDASTCSVKFTPTKTGSYTIAVTYNGDTDHAGGTASSTFKVVR